MSFTTILFITTILQATAPQAAPPLFATTPDLCSKVVAVSEGRIDLATDGTCPQVKGKVSFDGPPGKYMIYVNGDPWGEQEINEPVITETTREVVNRAREVAAGYVLTNKETPQEINEQAQSIAQEIAIHTASPEFQSRIDEYRGYWMGQSGGTVSLVPDWYQQQNRGPKQKTNDNTNQTHLISNEKLYVFVSSSVPKETLRAFASDLNILGDSRVVMVMRGMIGGLQQIAPTVGFARDILSADPLCSEEPSRECATFNVDIEVDPFPFRDFNIDRVPAVVLVEGINEMNDGGGKNAYIYYGDAALSYSLGEIAVASKNPRIQAFANTLKRLNAL